MHLRTTPQHTVAIALAAGALLASPAIARPVDKELRDFAPTSSLAGTVEKRQDLRGEHARDAARVYEGNIAAAPKQDLRGEHARDAALRAGDPPVPVAPGPAPKAPAIVPAVTDTGDGSGVETWLIVGLGLAGAGIAAGTAGVVRARRVAT